MINVDVKVLDSVQNNLKNLSNDLLTQSNRMNDIIEGVNSAWQSEYTYMYIQSINKIQEDINNLSKNVANISNSIGYISNQVKQAETELEKQFNIF